jgi:phospholipid-transporting ATPase
MSTSASSSVSNNGFIDIDIYSKSVTEKGVKKPWRANSITTTKYTLLNWLPKSIWAQFRRIANVYFLVISVLMMIGTYATSLWSTPLSPYSTVSTLVFVLLVTSIKEGYEDLQRAKSDSYENLKNVIVITFTEDGIKHERTIKSQDVCPGDIIKLEGSTAVPVDLLLIYTSLYSDGNKCYIETANLDGETNLKLREAPSQLLDEFPEAIASGVVNKCMFEGVLNAQAPNKNMHKFIGTLKLKASKEEVSLAASNVILRGSQFANTDWGYGIAVYAGQETKIQLNSRHVPTKMSKIEGYLNNAIILIFIAQCFLVSASVISIYFLGFQNFDGKLPYVYPNNEDTDSILPLWLEQWVVFFLLYNNFIPISLYVTIEMVNLGQGYLIANDELMYRADLDTPCGVRSSNLVQELGGVSNIFSDKTGTLTCNEMRLVKFVLNGRTYDIMEKARSESNADSVSVASDSGDGAEPSPLHYPPSPSSSPPRTKSQRPSASSSSSSLPFEELFGTDTQAFLQFCRCLTTCHTVVRESDGTYRAESPDELALVEAMGLYDCQLLERGSKDMNVQICGRDATYEVLAVNAFDSDRKRMSVLLRQQDSQSDPLTGDKFVGAKYMVMCKGADNIMLPLCVGMADTKTTARREVDKSLIELSNMGLRTLVIAQKDLSESDALAWLQTWKAASVSTLNREELLAEAGGQLEMDMQLVGLTAIEDRLQDEVPEVISELSVAGIIVWMLTGDKLETAVNIGRSCNLILGDTRLSMIVGSENPEDFYQSLKKEYNLILQNEPGKPSNTALVLDGPAFSMFNEIDLEQRMMLLALGAGCRSVIACRLTPTQKKDLVNLVKVDTVPRTTTLSIGDGANDVSMIMEADVGVGIYGKEGRQAANNADFAIGEFKFLRRLLLVHGRWNYIRQSRVFLYSMHKNMVITLTLFWFGYYDAMSGTSLYESWIYSAFNIILGLPIIFYGILDRDISDTFAMKHPETYGVGRKNELLRNGPMSIWILNAVLYASVVCLLYYTALYSSFTFSISLFEMGTTVYVGLCMALQMKVAFMHHQWAYPQVCVMAISIIGMFICLFTVSAGGFSDQYHGVAETTLTTGLFWCFGMFFGPLVCVYIDMIGTYTQWLFFPTALQLQRECEHRGYFGANWLRLSGSPNEGYEGCCGYHKYQTPDPSRATNKTKGVQLTHRGDPSNPKGAVYHDKTYRKGSTFSSV